MQVFLAREHVMSEGATVFGIFSNLDAAIACIKKKEIDGAYEHMEDGPLKGKIVYNRTDETFSLQVLVYEVQS